MENVDIDPRLFGDLGLDETILIEDNMEASVNDDEKTKTVLLGNDQT